MRDNFLRRLSTSLLMAGLLLVGCYSPSYHDGDLQCSASGQCPMDYHCAVDNTCWHNGHDPEVAQDAGNPAPDTLPAGQADSYVAGLILLAAAPCTAMVFVWSRLTNGHPLFTLSQVALNDTIMVFAFAPIVALLLGLSSITVPWDTLITSVVLYIVIPVAIAQAWRKVKVPGHVEAVLKAAQAL